jgi:hypothetical protein
VLIVGFVRFQEAAQVKGIIRTARITCYCHA